MEVRLGETICHIDRGICCPSRPNSAVWRTEMHLCTIPLLIATHKFHTRGVFACECTLAPYPLVPYAFV